MPKRILLADDSITIQKVVELTFSDGDYEIVSANNGARALQKLAESMPDIILSDIIMPEKNGYEVCEFVKSHPEYRDIPVILLTGTFEPFDPDRAEKAGCDAVVTKPFESQSLINKVEELIQKRRILDDESRAARADAFVSQPLDSFVRSPAVEQSEDVPVEPSDAGLTMPWQMPTVDQSSEYAEHPATESPFSTEEPPTPASETAEDSPFGADSGWAPISTEQEEPAAEAFSPEPFEAGAPQDDPELSRGFEGESIFAPEESPGESRAESDDEARDDAIFDGASESAPADGEPFAAAGPELESNTDDATTRAWAVPVDGAWAEPAAVEAEPSAEETEAPGFGRTIPFPGVHSETPQDEDLQTDQNAATEGAASDQTPTVVDELLLATPWSEQPGSSETLPDDEGVSQEAAAYQQTDDVWNVTPAAEVENEQVEPAFSEPSDESPGTFEAPVESASPWETEEAPAPEEEGAAQVATATSEAPETQPPGRTLTDEDVERIARRVVQLMTPDMVKNIAWEVVPDIAEKVVRARVSELENE